MNRQYRLLIASLVSFFIACIACVAICNAGGIEMQSPYVQWTRTTLAGTITAARVGMTQAAAGFPIAPGQTFSTATNFAAIYGICDTGKTASVAYFEETNK